jgi:hypothetical protein
MTGTLCDSVPAFMLADAEPRLPGAEDMQAAIHAHRPSGLLCIRCVTIGFRPVEQQTSINGVPLKCKPRNERRCPLYRKLRKIERERNLEQDSLLRAVRAEWIITGRKW